MFTNLSADPMTEPYRPAGADELDPDDLWEGGCAMIDDNAQRSSTGPLQGGVPCAATADEAPDGRAGDEGVTRILDQPLAAVPAEQEAGALVLGIDGPVRSIEIPNVDVAEMQPRGPLSSGISGEPRRGATGVVGSRSIGSIGHGSAARGEKTSENI